jgi:nitroreductase
MRSALRSLIHATPWLHRGASRLRRWLRPLPQKSNGPAERLQQAYAYDHQLFAHYAAYSTGTLYREGATISDANLEALISIEYHRLEKGLSHHQRRAQFGSDAAERLTAALNVAQAMALDTPITRYATAVLESYWREIQQERGERVGWQRLSRQAVRDAAAINADQFFPSRHSIRCFDAQRSVDTATILKAIALARHTPSVCNRQTWKVVICESETAKAKALALQNGNLGFGHLASHVLIVGSDRSCFASIGERNQAWIEAGMFAMSLVYALHAQGLGTCCLNWSVEPDKDQALKLDLDIPESLAIGMMIAVGALPDEILVAESRRVGLEQIVSSR